MNKAPSGYKQTELGMFPSDWIVKRIEDLEPYVTSGSRGWAAFYSEYGAPFLRITNLTRNSIYPNLYDLRYVNIVANEAEASRTSLSDGDVLVSVTADIGIIGYVTSEIPKPAYINQHIALLRFNPTVTCSKFVSYFLASEKPQKLFRAATDSGAKAGMNLTTVQQVCVALPPTKAEQESIAEALNDTDALIESLKQLLVKKRQIKQGTMQELLTGKRHLPGFGGEWKSIPLSQMGNCLRGVSYNPSADLSTFDTPTTVRLLRSNNVQGSEIVPTDIQYVNTERVSYAQRLRMHDVLICMANGSRELVGKAGYFSLDDGFEYTFGAFMGCFRSNADSFDAGFVFSIFQTAAYRNHIGILLAGSSINNLLPSSIESLVVSVPASKNEQTAIATILSNMDTEITALESKLTKARHIKQGMMQQLLTGQIRLL